MDIVPVSISPSNATIRTAEEFLNLSCSADIVLDSPSQNVTFEWFFGPNNSTLPTGVTVSNVTNNSNTYTSTLQLSSLTQSHTGTYTCRIGGNKGLAASATVTVSVNKSKISTTVTHSSGSNVAVTVTTVVLILIIIAAIITVVVITAIVYR